MAKIGAKRSAKGQSKRLGSATRHKIDRKRRENKRDLRKAAKAMRKTGLRIRPKKQRERTKLALSLSSKDPNKERVLNQLLQSRERVRLKRQERRADNRAAAAAAAGDDDEEEQGNKRDALWMHPISGNDLEKQQRLARRQQEQETKVTEKKKGIRRFLAFPPGRGNNNPSVQLRKIISSMRNEVPAFLITIDARCALETVPWTVLDDIIADAISFNSSSTSSDENNNNSASSNTNNNINSGIVRNIVFVLTRADLVTTDVLVKGAVSISSAMKERYLDNDASVSSVIRFSCVASASLSTAIGSSQTLGYLHRTLLAKSAEILGERRAKLAQEKKDQSTTTTTTTTSNNNNNNNINTSIEGQFVKKDINKVVFCVYGLPNTGRTSLCSALVQKASPSACAVLQATDIEEVAQADQPRCYRFNNSKPITLLNVSESDELNNAPIVSGDVLFHRHSTIERMQNPELAAIKLLDDIIAATTTTSQNNNNREDFDAICRSFGQPGCSDAKEFLLGLGRIVRRECGFYTPHGGDSIAIVPQVANGLFASRSSDIDPSASGSGSTKSLLRAFHQVNTQKRDGSNAVRIGARVFLHELCRGTAGFRWYTNELPASFLTSQEQKQEQGTKNKNKKAAEATNKNSSSSSSDIATCLGAIFDSPPPPSRRNRGRGGGATTEEEETTGTEEKKEKTSAEIGLDVVVGLQHVSQTVLPTEAVSVQGIHFQSSGFTPQAELTVSEEDVLNEIPSDSSEDDEDQDEDEEEMMFDDDGAFLDEGDDEYGGLFFPEGQNAAGWYDDMGGDDEGNINEDAAFGFSDDLEGMMEDEEDEFYDDDELPPPTTATNDKNKKNTNKKLK